MFFVWGSAGSICKAILRIESASELWLWQEDFTHYPELLSSTDKQTKGQQSSHTITATSVQWWDHGDSWEKRPSAVKAEMRLPECFSSSEEAQVQQETCGQLANVTAADFNWKFVLFASPAIPIGEIGPMLVSVKTAHFIWIQGGGQEISIQFSSLITVKWCGAEVWRDNEWGGLDRGRITAEITRIRQNA